jgi:branched-chain amino acid transport system ATP-binding protein
MWPALNKIDVSCEPHARSESALEAIGLCKSFESLPAVSNVSLNVNYSELHAVIGPNGAGKSTLINLFSGDLRATSGKILIDGQDVTALGPDKRALSGIGRSYQKTTIFPNFTVFENVRLAAQAHTKKPLSFFGTARGDPMLRDQAMSALQTVGLEARFNTAARLLSHGEQRSLEIAMVLATEPRIMLLDEPLAGMGLAESRAMVNLIASLKVGRSILLVEHDMDAVFSLADRLTVMFNGQVIGSGKPAEVRDLPAVREAYLGPETVTQ